MKYIVVLADGMTDYKSVNWGTLLPAVCKTPNMDFLARRAEIGMARTVPEGFPGSGCG